MEENPEELWTTARAMEHSVVPNGEDDAEYLGLVYRAAQLGHVKAMVKLGEYACRRGEFVEGYYWTDLAVRRGAKGLSGALREIRARWMASGCPPGRENVHAGFSALQGSFARALLRIRCGIEHVQARLRMRELAEQGCEEARQFLES